MNCLGECRQPGETMSRKMQSPNAGLPDVPIGGVGNMAGPDDEIQEGDELPGQEAEEVMQPVEDCG